MGNSHSAFFISALVGTMLVFQAGSASAQTNRPETSLAKILGILGSDPTPASVFELVDTDKNGLIDNSELAVRKMAVFSGRDADKDAKLSRGELENLSDAVFRALDADGDGIVSGYEFNQAKLTKFSEIDADADGGITLSEFEAYRERIE